jgi:hypothetical protein
MFMVIIVRHTLVLGILLEFRLETVLDENPNTKTA